MILAHISGRFRTYITLSFLILFSISCEQETSSETFFEGEDLVLTAEGPLFEGENTAQGKIDIASVRSEHSSNSIFTEAMLTEFELYMPDGGNFDQFTQMTLLLVSESSEMKKVAVMNPVPEGVSDLSFQIAADQKGTAALVNGDELTFVLDFSLKEDAEDDIRFSARYKFEGTIKNK